MMSERTYPCEFCGTGQPQQKKRVTVARRAALLAHLRTRKMSSAAAFHLELAAHHGLVKFYARNDGLGFTIPYECQGIPHNYEPDFLITLANDKTLILEIKGMETDLDKAKHQAAKRWRDAVNNWGKLGQWAFHVNRDPQTLGLELGYILKG